MPTFNYFILTNHDNTLSKRFRVVYTGYKRVLKKNGTITDTIDGGTDISIGSIKERHSYIVRVRDDETEDNYGDKADLETFFRYNNPANSAITLTDHYGQTHSVVMWGEFGEQTMGIMIEGETAWFTVETLFIFL